MEGSGGGGGSPARVVNDRVYVAVGRDVRESKPTLSWALDNFGGDFRIIHVHRPRQLNPSPRPPEVARQEMESSLDEYIHMCSQAGVGAKKRYVETQDIGKGIVELIELHAITKLVMGAAANRCYFEEMEQLKSSKAKFVNQHAHPSCRIWFVCNGHLICSREGDLNTFDMDITPSLLPGSSVVESGLQNIRSPSLGSVHSRSNSSEVKDDLALVRYERGEGSNHITESNSVHAYEGYSQNQSYTGMEGSYSEDLYEQLDQAREEVVRAKLEALEELIRRQKAEKTANDATCKLKALENVYNEELRRRKDLEELLSKEKEALEVLNKRHEELQMLKEELLANQTSEPSSARGQEFIYEFLFSEIQEAIESFDQSLMIGEGEYGSTFKGSLHHTPVAINMLHLCNYHHEIQVASKLRRPNLVSLIGVCPDASAAIYEYLPNGNLEDQLSARDSSNHLSWQTQIHICADICAALMFLRSCYSMLHGDLKPRNILLHSNSVPKIMNFGLHSALSHSPTKGELSFASDVYSFGNVLFQLLTGRSALNLDELMQNALDVGNLSVGLDPTVGHWPFELAKEVPHLALSCGDSDSNDRPCLRSQVWPVLERMQTRCGASLSTRSGPEQPSEPPEYFTCPISHEIMQDPYVAADGFTYEAEAIRSWLSEHDTSPMTNLQLSNRELFPNQSVRSMILEWLQNQERGQPPEYFACPISHEIMQDPNVMADGFTYASDATSSWPSGQETSAMTNLQLSNRELFPNQIVRSMNQEWLQNQEPGEPPEYFTCPISHEIMQDPYVAADGFTYEGEAIRSWLSEHDTSPMTNLQLSNRELFPNQTVRSMIQDWLQNQERGQPPEYFACPISHEIMQDPNVAADGFTYASDATSSWPSGQETSPMTNLQLSNRELFPNQTVHSMNQERLQNQEPGEPSEYFTCPISHEIMQDPYVAADGFTYEAEAIRSWLSEHVTSPMTNLQLSNRELFPNQTVRSMIQDWLQNQERGQPPEYFARPISHEIMQDLNVAANGFTYASDATSSWPSGQETSPMTNLQLSNRELFPNQIVCSMNQEHLQNQEPGEPPEYFTCPISHEIMQDPYVAADGFTYEVEAIRSWLSEHDTSPMTNLQLSNRELFPNQTVRSMIQDWLQNQERGQPPEYFARPISHEIMQDPNVVADGFTYASDATSSWPSGQETSPMTNLQLSNCELFPNQTVRSMNQEQLQNQELGEPPEYFTCPISHEIMQDPYVAADGFTYEAEAIRSWLSEHDTSPMTNLQLSNRELFPNRIVCSMIQDWLQNQVPGQPPEYFSFPISHEIMQDPNVAANGFTYASDATSSWPSGQETSPMTNLQLSNRELFPNQTVRSMNQEQLQNQEPGEPPEYFTCPISHEIMQDPYVAADGFTYEAEAIRSWLSEHDTSPMTNLQLSNRELFLNRIVRSMIQDWLQNQVLGQPPEYFTFPISHEILQDPHVASDDFTYASEGTRSWLSGQETSSTTNLQLSNRELFPNQTVRSMIHDWLQNQERGQPPEYFACPISHEIMQDPYVAADGFTYASDTTSSWPCGQETLPMTNLQLLNRELFPNQTVRSMNQEWLQNQEPGEPSEYFTCPISYEIMQDPYVAADGFTYEAEAIRSWLSEHDTSPMTNLQLSNRELFPNQTVRSMIQDWLQNQERGQPPEYFVRPISHEIMQDPNVAVDGFTYSSDATSSWPRGQETSPMTNLQLSNRELFSNQTVRSMNQERLQNQESGEPPEYFTCPISHEIMQDPYVASDGFTYEAEAIRSWLSEHDTSPMTNLQLSNRELFPNQTVRSMIHDWLQNQERGQPPEYFACPISHIMQDPNVAADGVTYASDATSSWPSGQETSPMMNLQLSNRELFPNQTVRSMNQEQLQNQEPGEPPEYFTCPISHEIMQDPYVAADGFTYEAEAIRSWLREHDTSPMTNLQLSNRELFPNRIVRSMIQDWLQNQVPGQPPEYFAFPISHEILQDPHVASDDFTYASEGSRSWLSGQETSSTTNIHLSNRELFPNQTVRSMIQEWLQNIEPGEPPEHFACPISHEIMQDPYVAADGFTYEAEAIRSWLSEHDTSSTTNLQLSNHELFPNQSVRSMIQEWLQNQEPGRPHEYFARPISHEIMRDPHVASDSFTYASEATRSGLSGQETSPMTNLQLSNSELFSNQSVRSMIEEWLQNEEPGEAPEYFTCLISHEVMQDPYVAADGFTYEAEAIRSWLSEHDTSPMTNLQLSSRELFPNQTVRSMIQEWLQNR